LARSKNRGENYLQQGVPEVPIMQLENATYAVVGEVPTKRSSDHDPMIRHCRIIGRFES
jgi:negative regulator of sigma E activity